MASAIPSTASIPSGGDSNQESRGKGSDLEFLSCTVFLYEINDFLYSFYKRFISQSIILIGYEIRNRKIDQVYLNLINSKRDRED